MSSEEKSAASFEKTTARAWPEISRQLLNQVEAGDLHGAAEALIRYHQGLLKSALDTEPSEKLKDGIVKNYGYLDQGALKAARSIKLTALRPEQQAALALSVTLEHIAALLNKPDLATYYREQISLLTDLLNETDSPAYKSIEDSTIPKQISKIGQVLIEAIENEQRKR
jgi:hypothetical protein